MFELKLVEGTVQSLIEEKAEDLEKALPFGLCSTI